MHGSDRSAGEAAHHRRRHRWHHCRCAGEPAGARLHRRRVQRRYTDRRCAAAEGSRRHFGRAAGQDRQPGHERRRLAEAGQAGQRAVELERRRRRGHHPRHRHDGGNRLLPRPRGEQRQAGGAGRLDAAGNSGQCRRPGEPVRCGDRRRRSQGQGPRGDGRAERPGLCSARRLQDQHYPGGHLQGARPRADRPGRGGKRPAVRGAGW